MKTKIAVFLVLLAAMGGSLFAQGQNVKGTYGSGPPQASNVPGDIGSLYTDTAANVMYVCTAITRTNTSTTCTWTASGGSSSSGAIAGGSVVDPSTSPYNAKPGNAVFDAVFANTSQIVTSATAKFQTGSIKPQVGWFVFGTCCGHQGGTNHVGSVIQVPRGTITSIDSDTQIHVSIAATANQSGAALMFWPDATAAFQSAITAAWSSSNHCSTLLIPVGLYGVTIPTGGLGNTSNCNTAITNPSSIGASVQGFERLTSLILIDPSSPSPYTNACTGITIGCIFSQQGMTAKNFTVWGGEVSPVGGAHSSALMETTTDSLINNVLLAGMLSGETVAGGSFEGIRMVTPGNYCIYCLVDGVGAFGIHITAGLHVLTQVFSGDMDGQALLIDSGAGAKSNISGYGPITSAGFPTLNINGGTFFSTQDHLLCYNTANAVTGLQVAAGGLADINQAQMCFSTPSNTGYKAINVTGNGSILRLSHSNITGGSAGNSIIKTADTSVVYLDNVNIIAGPKSGITPTCTESNGLTCVAFGTSEAITVNITGNAAATSGTITVTLPGTSTPPAGQAAAAPCIAALSNAATAWNARATVMQATASTTAPTFKWDNNAAALAASAFQVVAYCPVGKL